MYVDFKLVLHGVLQGLGKQPLSYPPCAALSLTVAVGGQKSYARAQIDTRQAFKLHGPIRTYVYSKRTTSKAI